MRVRVRPQLPWADEGVGQWGLLSVAPEAMGSGVASALVREAEARLEPDCEEIQIEYNYTHGCSFSQVRASQLRLLVWCDFLGLAIAVLPARGHFKQSVISDCLTTDLIACFCPSYCTRLAHARAL
eukprot:2387859-Pleurochrysis_carterae.AAC.7